MKSSPLTPKTSPGQRKPMKRRKTKAERERLDRLTTAFAQEVYEACEHRCAVCGYEGPHLQAHHVVPKSTIRRQGLPLPLAGSVLINGADHVVDAVVWDPDNGLLVCSEPAPNRCHDRHTNAFKRIPRDKLRPENEAFAEAFGFGWFLEREYPGSAA